MWRIWVVSIVLVVISVFLINVNLLLGILSYAVGFSLGMTALLLVLMSEEKKEGDVNDKVDVV